MDACSSRNWSWPLEPTKDLAVNPWYFTQCDREQELLIKFEREQQEFGDSSQSWGRARETQSKVCPTLLPGSHLWASCLQRYLIGRDAMALQGFPVTKMKAHGTFSESQLADLAGNAFSVPVSLAVDLAILFNVRYSKARKEDLNTDLDTSAALINLLAADSDNDADDADSIGS